MSVSYSISGSVSYEVTDAFVDITTTVYGSNAIATSDEELLSLANEFVNTIPTTIGENKIVTHFTNYDDVFDFNSLTDTLDENNGYTPEASLDMTFGSEQNTYSYFVVVNIKNLADNVVYTNIASMTDNLTGVSIVATDSNLRIFSDQMEGQSIVFAYAISDLTQNQENVPIEFSLEFTCQTPYTYADLAETKGSITGGEGFLGNYKQNGERKYNNKLKSITFTNNQADFDMLKVVDKFDVGEVYGEDGSKASELYIYFIPNGELFDAYCYAPVNVIYAPTDCYGFFSSWVYVSDTYGDIDYAYRNANVEMYDFKAFDTSKCTDFTSFFLDNVSLIEIKNMYFDTSNARSLVAMFCGVKLNTLDLSNFNFGNISNMTNIIAMLGLNSIFLKENIEMYEYILQSSGNDKIKAVVTIAKELGYYVSDGYIVATNAFSMQIQKIICPKDLNGLVIATPGETPYLIEGTNETTYYLVEGATLIAQN